MRKRMLKLEWLQLMWTVVLVKMGPFLSLTIASPLTLETAVYKTTNLHSKSTVVINKMKLVSGP